MATGQIKRLARDRGFGFIRPAGETEDIFFHSSAVLGEQFDNLKASSSTTSTKASPWNSTRVPTSATPAGAAP